MLEAFGNAQTVMNNNSSRFGKYIELMFDSKGHLQGGTVGFYCMQKRCRYGDGVGSATENSAVFSLTQIH